MSVLLTPGMSAPAAEQLKWTREAPHGFWCACVQLAANETVIYRIGGPLGSWWYLYLPDDTVEGFGTKRDAVAYAQEHFEKHFKVIASRDAELDMITSDGVEP